MVATTLAVAAVPAGAAPAADLSVTLTRTPVLGQASVDPITFTAVVTNNGPASAQQVTFVDPLSDVYADVKGVSTTAGSCETEPFRQITCSLGTLASGASATVTMRLLINESGYVTDSAAVISATGDPDDSNNVATASVVMSAPPPYEDLIVTGYFKLVLGLDITDEQLDRWDDEANEYSYEDFALQLLKTYTFRSNWVDETFQKLLGRAPDAAALAVFTRQLSQRVTYDQIDANIAGSNEYYARSGGTPQDFVSQVVADFTGHPPTDAFRAELLDRLAQGQSRTQVATRVITSGLGRLAWVKWTYRRYYKREVRAFEAHNALEAFRTGIRPAQELANLLGDFEIVESFLPGYYGEYSTGAKPKAA
jgi:uncharacterized repeat protein (TIGR01451 family)